MPKRNPDVTWLNEDLLKLNAYQVKIANALDTRIKHLLAATQASDYCNKELKRIAKSQEQQNEELIRMVLDWIAQKHQPKVLELHKIARTLKKQNKDNAYAISNLDKDLKHIKNRQDKIKNEKVKEYIPTADETREWFTPLI